MPEPRGLLGEHAFRERGLVSERELESWLSWARVAGLIFALLELTSSSQHFPPGYKAAAWAVTGVLAVGTVVLFVLARSESPSLGPRLGFTALVFDAAVVAAYSTIFSYEYGSQVRWALILVVIEGALRYGLLGGILTPLLLIPFLFFDEWWRSHYFGPPSFTADRATFPAGVLILGGLVVGWLVRRLENEARLGLVRASEAETLRDELGRHVDALEAANRCARALGSSLEIEDAFGAFIGELRGFVPFDRTSIVLVEDDAATTIATAGRGADDLFPPGSVAPLESSVLERVLAGQTVARRDLAETDSPEDRMLVALGLRSQLVAPLPVGARPIGMLTVSRESRDAFSDEEIELVSLLGRLVATAVQNIRAYEAERRQGGGAAPALGAAGRLRLARVARAAQPDGRRDRCGADAAGPLARAHGGAAGDVPDADRERDEPAGDARRRRARHVADRGGDVQLHVRRGRPDAPHRRRRRDRRGRPGRGARALDRDGPAAARPRRRRAAAPGALEPDRQRREVLGAGRRGRGRGGGEGRRRPRLRHRPRPGHPARPAEADLREVRPRRRPGSGEAGNGSRPVHRALDRRGARRLARRRVRAERRRDLHPDAARGVS